MADDFAPAIDDAVWYEVREFVLDVVGRCEGRTAYDALDLKIATTKLCAWAVQTAGYELDIDLVFRRDVIAYFIATGAPEYKPAGRGNLRSQLLRMSEVLLPGLTQRRLAPLPPSDPTRPYKPKEEVTLRSWAAAQSTPARRANAQVLLALGFGAGLSASELGNVHTADLLIDPDGVVVHVAGEREREVPVLRTWEPALIARARLLAPDRFVFRENHTAFYPNLVSNFVNRSHAGAVRPQTQRMRTTWILYHLETGTPIVPFLNAAGIDSLQGLSRYLKFLPSVPPDVARSRLRGDH